MKFVHPAYNPKETIAAIATPPGEGGVAIIRISGPASLLIANKIFNGPVHSYATHTAHYGQVQTVSGQYIDDALLLVFLGKRSYTGEDTVEIQCHGGSLISRRVLEAVLEAGARAAGPGEFTMRAFLNGKLDLTQAEAVQKLIAAKSEQALEVAENHLKGSLSEKIGLFQTRLTHIAAILEAWVDFPEEGLEFASMDEICSQIQNTLEEMQRLAATFHNGRIMHEGITLCIVGSPNVGKSSLLNALLDKERAIVSPIPGTTRDLIEDHIRLKGLHIKLMDTAGIRPTADFLEQEGIRRSQAAMSQADLLLFVLDAHRGIGHEESQILSLLPKSKTVAVWNKSDLPHHSLPQLDFNEIVKISAMQRLGLEQLHAAIDRLIWKEGPPSKEEVVITAERHREALLRAIDSSQTLLQGLKKGTSPEFLTIEMRSCLHALGTILGTDVGEDILNAIFSTFCIGK